uniref:Transmembrane protein 168 n=1 Tax=Marmota marmota marmota TaxID=9994 RepID=A0A8C6AFE8_MARMA
LEKKVVPRVTYPLVHLANWLCGQNLLWICKTCFRCLKRLKMSWLLLTVLEKDKALNLSNRNLDLRMGYY